MFSFVAFFITSLGILSPKIKEINEEDSLVRISTAAIFALSLQGLFCLLLSYINLTRFPVIILALVSLLLVYIYNNGTLFSSVKITFSHLKDDINKFLIPETAINSKNIFKLLILLIIIGLYLVSVGPINHPDSTDYHYGYPYQIWLRNGFFIDGGLHQPLLGISEYAYIAFIQERTIWFIRTTQALLILPLVLFLLRSESNKLALLSLLSTPVLIVWITTGKPLFVSDICIAITYLHWSRIKHFNSLKYLIVSIILAISFKISSSIIALPILFHLIIYYFYDTKNDFHKKDLIKVFRSNVFSFSVLTLIVILLSRHYIIGNFSFPLFTNIFNPGEDLTSAFAEYLKSYGRTSTFPYHIFIPTNLGSIASSLGPAILVIVSVSLYFLYKNFRHLLVDPILLVSTTQIALLLLFCQGRGNYYVTPIILIIYVYNYYLSTSGLPLRLYKIIITFSILIQLFCLSIYSTISLYQSYNSFINYENSMENISSGYQASKYLNENANGIFLDLANRNTRSYYNTNYIDKHVYYKCEINTQKLIDKSTDQVRKICLKKLKVKTLLSKPAYLIKDSTISCTTRSFISATRNPFNRRKSLLEICNINS
tara:strand:+ start:905 stop:2701 length:1797 start_codon:yes stop_codon:yes gene_type:complete